MLVSRSCWNGSRVGLSEDGAGSEALGEWEQGEKRELLAWGQGEARTAETKIKQLSSSKERWWKSRADALRGANLGRNIVFSRMGFSCQNISAWCCFRGFRQLSAHCAGRRGPWDTCALPGQHLETRGTS